MRSLARNLSGDPKPDRPATWSPEQVLEAIHVLEGLYGVARLRVRFDPLEELVSCILSQHTSDKASFPAFTRMRERFPDWESVLEAPLPEVAESIKDAGLFNQKAKSIVGCLQAIRHRFGSVTLEPLHQMSTSDAKQWLLSLPGVGPKTASLVLCFSFGRETIPVDTHVFRVSRRLGILSENTTESKAHDEVLDIVPYGWGYRFHAALIQHGRNLCRAPSPECAPCPLQERCFWYRSEPSDLSLSQPKRLRGKRGE